MSLENDNWRQRVNFQFLVPSSILNIFQQNFYILVTPVTHLDEERSPGSAVTQTSPPKLRVIRA